MEDDVHDTVVVITLHVSARGWLVHWKNRLSFETTDDDDEDEDEEEDDDCNISRVNCSQR